MENGKRKPKQFLIIRLTFLIMQPQVCRLQKNGLNGLNGLAHLWEPSRLKAQAGREAGTRQLCNHFRIVLSNSLPLLYCFFLVHVRFSAFFLYTSTVQNTDPPPSHFLFLTVSYRRGILKQMFTHTESSYIHNRDRC
jgi:hypothetical protein